MADRHTHDVPVSDKSAAPTAYGFMRQLDRVFLWLLLKAEISSIVTFECYDDVGVKQSDGSLLAEQDKAFTAENSNPLRNRSKEFWKTLSNWIEECISGRIDPNNTQFLLWLSGQCEPGTWTKALLTATTDDDVSAAFMMIASELEAAGDSEKEDGAYKYIGKVVEYLSSQPETVRAVVRRMKMEHGSGSAAEDLRQEFRLRYDVFYDAMGEDIIAHGKAWIDEAIKAAVEQNRPACLSVDELKERMRIKLIELRNRRILPEVRRPSAESVDLEVRALPTYIRQLGLIEEDMDEMLDAATVYLRSAQQRTVWADSSYWGDTSWEDLKANLLSGYRTEKRRANMTSGLNSVQQGQVTYGGCKHSCIGLAADWTPDFVRGCMHTLANVPEMGWHPQYDDLLRDKGENK